MALQQIDVHCDILKCCGGELEFQKVFQVSREFFKKFLSIDCHLLKEIYVVTYYQLLEMFFCMEWTYLLL